VFQPPEFGSLTDFTRDALDVIQRLKETGLAHVLTVDGRAEAVVLDVASYERLWELADRADAIRGIREGLESVRRGEGMSAAEAFARIRAKIDSEAHR
jgi:hypothetical protein